MAKQSVKRNETTCTAFSKKVHSKIIKEMGGKWGVFRYSH